MSRDWVVFAVLVVAFAVLATAHVTLAVGLRRRRRSLALVLPPLAPLHGWREGMRVRSAVWVAAAVVYTATLFFASR